MLSLLGTSGGLVVAGYAASYGMAKRLRTETTKACVWEVTDSIYYAAHVPVMLYLVGLSLLELDWSTVSGRWHQTTAETRIFLALYVTQSVIHMGVLCMKRDVASPALYAAHHVLSIACYFSALWTGRMHFWGVLDALCEVTNIFLNNLFLFRQLGLSSRMPFAYKVNGACLWLSYVVFRLALFPYWLWLFIGDIRAHPESTWDTINVFERYAYSGTTVLLLVISTLWFGKITRGLLAALGLVSGGGSANEPAVVSTTRARKAD